jgi:hypothetical protein
VPVQRVEDRDPIRTADNRFAVECEAHRREVERRVILHLLVPTRMVKRIGYLMVAGINHDMEPMPEEAQLH